MREMRDRDRAWGGGGRGLMTKFGGGGWEEWGGGVGDGLQVV